MKKIGIITLHFYENFGSVLQAYALQEKIKDLYPEADIAIINYIPDGSRYTYFSEQKLQNRYEEKRKLFDIFRFNVLGIPEVTLTSKDLSELDSFDYLITGSDQVWNPEITHFDPAYFLNFADRKTVKISYAASLAICSSHPQMSGNIFRKFLPEFDFISIREKKHEDYIQSFADVKVETVVDPTLLLTKEAYAPIISKTDLCEEKYILLYFLTHDPNAIDVGNMLAHKYGFKLIHYFADMPDRLFHANSDDFSFVGPEEFLWYVNNAELVFTNSFHGTVFSILFEKPFYTYTAKREMLSRVIYLTEMIGLESRRLTGYMPPNDITLDINFHTAKEDLQKKRDEAISFLSTALDYKN